MYTLKSMGYSHYIDSATTPEPDMTTTALPQSTIDALIAAGGKRWTTGDKDRVYFNDLATRAGLECERYKTGNVCSASFRGESISNAAATRISSALYSAKLYLDLATGQWHWAAQCRDIDVDAVMADIIADINAAVTHVA